MENINAGSLGGGRSSKNKFYSLKGEGGVKLCYLNSKTLHLYPITSHDAPVIILLKILSDMLLERG